MSAIVKKAGNFCRPSLKLLQSSVRYVFPNDRWEKYIGDREIVGAGVNGSPIYFDDVMMPFPAIRFQRNNPYIQALKEKEKCDWRNLTVEEKKCLYRASFCQTYAEMTAPTGHWKSVIGFTLLYVSCGMWLYIFLKKNALDPPPEEIYKYENVRARIKRIIDAEVEHMEGYSYHWDYEKEQWKDGYSCIYYDGTD